jgi:hypothetical protein
VACVRGTVENLTSDVWWNLDFRHMVESRLRQHLSSRKRLRHSHHLSRPPLLCVVLSSHLPRGSVSAARVPCGQPSVSHLGMVVSSQGVPVETLVARAPSGLKRRTGASHVVASYLNAGGSPLLGVVPAEARLGGSTGPSPLPS